MVNLERLPGEWGSGSPPPAILGFIIGTGVSLSIWVLVGLSAWAILTH